MSLGYWQDIFLGLIRGHLADHLDQKLPFSKNKTATFPVRKKSVVCAQSQTRLDKGNIMITLLLRLTCKRLPILNDDTK